jgi:hypothetical protein
VGNKKHREAKFILEVDEQFDGGCLHEDVECAGDLVADQHVGSTDECAGDGYTLALST